MNFKSMTDQAVAEEIGRRIDQIRLERNLTQQQLADAVGLSRVSYARLVAGQAKFINVIAVLRVLDQLSLVERFVPETMFSPLEQLKMRGKQRRRATGSRGGLNDEAASDAKNAAVSSEPDDMEW